jgi:DNA-binding transcriptional MocR family regulator
MFLDPGDYLLVEEFTFTAAIDAMVSFGINVIPVPLDDSGADPARFSDILDDLAARHIKVSAPLRLVPIPRGSPPPLSSPKHSTLFQ